MYKFLIRNGQIVAFGLGLLIILIYGIIVYSNGSQLNGLEAMDDVSGINFFNFGLMAAIVLIGLAAFFMLVFGVYQVAMNPKDSLKGILGFAAIVLIFIVTYSMASGEAVGGIAKAVKKVEEAGGTMSPATLKWVHSAVATGLIMIGITVLSLVVTGIRGIFK